MASVRCIWAKVIRLNFYKTVPVLPDDLSAARQNLWAAQKRFGYFPDINIEVNGFRFNFKNQEIWWTAPLLEPYLKFELAPQTLQAILERVDHWNNVEIGCRLRIWRKPNIYMPDVHLLMSFFHLPRT